jgi:hypothetical protein
VVAGVGTFVGSTEAGLAGEAIDEVEFSPHDHSAATLLAFVDDEGAVVEVKIMVIIVEHHGEHSFLETVDGFGLVVAVHKDIHADGVAVEVAEEEDFSGLQGLLHHELGVVVDGVETSTGGSPLPIEVLPHQGAAVVAYDDSIGVQHWDDLYYIRVTQELSLRVLTHQELDHPLHHPGGIGLSRVHSRCQNHSLSHSDLLRLAGEIGHDEHVDVVPCQTFAEDRFSNFFFIFEGADAIDESTDI